MPFFVWAARRFSPFLWQIVFEITGSRLDCWRKHSRCSVTIISTIRLVYLVNLWKLDHANGLVIWTNAEVDICIISGQFTLFQYAYTYVMIIRDSWRQRKKPLTQ